MQYLRYLPSSFRTNLAALCKYSLEVQLKLALLVAKLFNKHNGVRTSLSNNLIHKGIFHSWRSIVLHLTISDINCDKVLYEEMMTNDDNLESNLLTSSLLVFVTP